MMFTVLLPKIFTAGSTGNVTPAFEAFAFSRRKFAFENVVVLCLKREECPLY
jgi:hypothetical protein